MKSCAARALAAFVAVMVCFLFSGEAGATDLVKADLDTPVADGIAQIGNKKYPLPPGEWTLVARTTRSVQVIGGISGGRTVSAILLYREGGALRAGMVIAATLDPFSALNWTTDGACDRKDLVYKQVLNRSPNLPECIYVNHIVNALRNTGDWANDAALWLERHHVSVPATVLSANYEDYQSSGYVTLRIYINPEVSRQRPSSRPGWGENDWHKDRVENDPARKEYLDKVIAWTRSLPGAYGPAFNRDTPAPIPALPD